MSDEKSPALKALLARIAEQKKTNPTVARTASDRPHKLEQPPRAVSGQMHAVQAYRAKLDSIQDGQVADAEQLNSEISSFVDKLRGTSAAPPPLPPARPIPVELPMSDDDIVGWDDDLDIPIRRRDLVQHAPVDPQAHDTLTPPGGAFPPEPDTLPENLSEAPTVPPPPARVYRGTGTAQVPEPPKRTLSQKLAALLRPGKA